MAAPHARHRRATTRTLGSMSGHSAWAQWGQRGKDREPRDTSCEGTRSAPGSPSPRRARVPPCPPVAARTSGSAPTKARRSNVSRRRNVARTAITGRASWLTSSISQTRRRRSTSRGWHTPRATDPNDRGRTLRAARLRGGRRRNALTDALRDDDHLAPYPRTTTPGCSSSSCTTRL